jgi:hypothetical protein
MLLWEISSGKPPFYTEGKSYDICLAINISQGLRETPFPDTPKDYINIYTGKYDTFILDNKIRKNKEKKL